MSLSKKNTAKAKAVAVKKSSSTKPDRAGTTTKSIDRSPAKKSTKKIAKKKAKKSFSPDRWECPECGTSNPNNWNSCKRCGWVNE